MDMLSWTKLSPTCKIRATSKKFFNQYMYKAILYVPMGLIIRAQADTQAGVLSLESQVHQRKNNFFKWHGHNHTAYITQRKKDYLAATVEQLEYWTRVLNENKSIVKYRIEEPHLSVYTNDEQLLYELSGGDSAALREVFRPQSELAKLTLESNQIVVKKPTEYQYKIFFKENYNIDTEIRASIGQYLENLGDEVKVPQGAKYNFENRRLWFRGCYIYAKDDKILTYLGLMAPGIISQIFKQVYIP